MTNYLYIGSMLSAFASFYFSFKCYKGCKEKISPTALFALIEDEATMSNDAWTQFYVYKKYFNVTTTYNQHKKGKTNGKL